MSPLKLEIILHHYGRCDKFDGCNKQMYDEIIFELQNEGIIDRKDFPKTTPKGIAFVEMLLATPYPEKAWFDPRFKKQTE